MERRIKARPASSDAVEICHVLRDHLCREIMYCLASDDDFGLL